MKDELNILQVNDLSTGYGDNTVLQNVTFQIGHGEVLAVVGQNGSGKSTLIKSLAGLLPLKKGSVKFMNDNLNSSKPHTLVKHGISCFLQGGLIMPSLTVKEHLEIAASQSGRNLNNSVEIKVYEQFPKLKNLIDKRAGNLSGGERQMLSFAILIVQETKLWLLDEPTAGLSPEMVDFSSSFLKKKNKEDNITILLIEHNMDVAFNLASNVIVAKNGTFSRKFGKSEFKSPKFLNENVYN